MDIKNFSELLAVWPESGEAPPAGWSERALALLRAALVIEMRRRGLWHSPPRYLGVLGAKRWPEGLEELVSDAYVFVFAERLSALRAQSRVRENIDGVVVKSLRNFLHERQQDGDRLGYLLFDAVRNVVAEHLEQGKLWQLGEGETLRNGSVLSSSPERHAEPVSSETLAELAPRWNDQLLPEVLTGHGRARVEVRQRLLRLLAELPGQGIECFRLGDLVEPLKADLKRRWVSTLALEGGAEAAADPSERWLSLPGGSGGRRLDFEERQSFRRLVECVYRQIGTRAGEEPLRAELAQIWSCFHGWARSGEEDRPPTERGLATLLGVSRDRVAMLVERLRGLVGICQGILAGKVAELVPMGEAR